MENLDPVRLVEAFKLATQETPYAAAITMLFILALALTLLIRGAIVPLLQGIAAFKRRNGGSKNE